MKLPEKCKFVSQHVRAIAKMYFFFQICITARLERHLQKKAWVASFGRPKMTPQSLLASTTGLSPYLRFGCLSTRLFYHELTDLYKKIKKSCPPLSLHGQILWREFFYWWVEVFEILKVHHFDLFETFSCATKNPNFDKMAGNPICVQIPWNKNPEALVSGTFFEKWLLLI